jgi:hypothetical protein
VVIDPRERAQEIKMEQKRKKDDRGGGRSSGARERDGKRREDRPMRR